MLGSGQAAGSLLLAGGQARTLARRGRPLPCPSAVADDARAVRGRQRRRRSQDPWRLHLARNLAGAPDDLLLKVTPPRVPRHQVARPRLQADHERLRDHPVILVQAPAGFGKTSLLAQWRREHLAHGAVVAWLSAQPQDDPQRLVQGLALAVRTGAGRPTFGHTLLEAAAPAGLEGVTVWLAEVAQTALDIVLIVDEADRLPAAHARGAGLPAAQRAAQPARRGRRARRLPARASTTSSPTGSAPSSARRSCASSSTRRSNWCASASARRVDRDAAARLHELAEGWPLGLQLALSVMAARQRPAGRDLGDGGAGRRACASSSSTCCWPTWTRPTWRS